MKSKDLKNLKEYLSNCIVTPSAKAELIGYLDEAFLRIINTFKLIPDIDNGTLLEIGANPYFLTILIKKFKHYNVSIINYFGENLNSKGNQTIENEKYGDKYLFEFDHINIEKELIPHPKNSFDVVIYGEVIEHLIDNPIFTLYNIHNVLKENGLLILSTPNVFRYDNLFEYLFNRKVSIYDPYSGYGIYGRHNREYSLYEIIDILEKLGFSIISKKTIVVKGNAGIFNIIFKIKEYFQFGDYILISAKKGTDFNWYFPDYLYRGAIKNFIIDDYIKMGKNCYIHIDSSWNGLEKWEDIGGVRWTKKKSSCYLKPQKRTNCLKITFYSPFDNFKFTVFLFQKNQLLLSSEVTGKYGWDTLSIDIPNITEENLTIDFEMRNSWSPNSLGMGNDARELGIAIHELKLV